MTLVLKDKTIINNAVCSDKIIEIQVNDYGTIASIYASVTNENLNGAHWETSTEVITGTYGSVEIVSSSMNNNVIRFNLIDARSAEEERLIKQIEVLEKENVKLKESIVELSQSMDARKPTR